MSKSVETASNLPMVLILLPFLGSGFVPTDSMPAGLRWFAEYQPFTPIIETVRGLLLGTPIGNDARAGRRLVRRDRRWRPTCGPSGCSSGGRPADRSVVGPTHRTPVPGPG